MTTTAFDLVNWESVGVGIWYYIVSFLLYTIKHVRRFCGTEKMIMNMGFWEDYKYQFYYLAQEITYNSPLLSSPDE